MKWVMTAVALGLAMPAAARDLAVPTDKGWKHAKTGLILMPQLAGMSRTALSDATQTEHDVAAQYDTPDKSVFATIYLFHPAIADVSLWFDRSQTALETRTSSRTRYPRPPIRSPSLSAAPEMRRRCARSTRRLSVLSRLCMPP